MGKKPKKDGAATSAPKTSAETISDDQLYSLTEQHRQKYELLLEGRHKANKALIDYGKIIKSDLGAHGLQDIKDLISLDTPEGEAAMKADMERQARVLRWMGVPIGSQGALFGDTDRTPITERAFNEGKRQGLAGEKMENPHHQTTEAHRSFNDGFSQGQETLATKGFSKLDDTPKGLSKEEWAKKTAADNEAVSEAIKTGTVHQLGDKTKASAAADSLASH